MRRLWFPLVLTSLLGCVPEDPPGFRRDAGTPRATASSKTRAATARPKPRREPDAARLDKGELAASALPVLTAPFRDDFERSELGADWRATSPLWKLQNGALCVRGARNRPAWLLRRLPTNARIEFDATSTSPDGDLKVEVWGDGKSYATQTSYSNATSYVLVFGGWKNTLHVLARLDEHKDDRLALEVDAESDDPRAQPVSEGQSYRFKIERVDGKTVRWYIDDIEIHSLADPAPLIGPGHEHLGFNDWNVPACFDNLRITPLEG